MEGWVRSRKEENRKRGKEGGRQGGREGEREGGREGKSIVPWLVARQSRGYRPDNAFERWCRCCCSHCC